MNVNAFSLRFLFVALVHPPIVCVGFIHYVGVFPTGTDLIDHQKEKNAYVGEGGYFFVMMFVMWDVSYRRARR